MANQKGGVGKTTTSVSLAACLSERGLQILVVDLDPQGNASTGLGIARDRRPLTTYDVLTGAAPLGSSIVASPATGVHVVPATIDLAGIEVELATQLARESRLSRALTGQVRDFDVVLLDCPPSLGLLTVNALVAAARALLTAEAHYFALQGVEQAMEVVELARDGLNPQLSLIGVLLNRADMRTIHSREALASLRERFGEEVFDTVVRSSIAYAESAERATSILDYRPDLGEDYLALADEVLRRLSGFAPAREQLARIGA